MSLNVLVLHALGDFRGIRKTSRDHALCYQRHAPRHRFLYHDVKAPVTDALRRLRFHAVFLDTTALCLRYSRPREVFEADKARYAFLAEGDAVRVAFPQDDYDHSAILDAWLDDWRTDLVYSVVWEHRALFYPRMLARGTVLPALTGYVEDADVERAGTLARPFDARRLDVGYRARHLPAQFGHFGQIKVRLAGAIAEAAAGRGLAVDVSTRPEDVFLDDAWGAFLGDCRWVPGTEGGSSVWDPDGGIADRVAEYVAREPGAPFEAVAAACLAGTDRYLFRAISPRLFETTLARSGQLLVEGEYLGLLRPWEHYVPLDPALTRVGEALDASRDRGLAARMIEATYATLVETERFRYRHHVGAVLERVERLVEERRVPGSAPDVFERLAARHRVEVEAHARRVAVRWRPAARRLLARTGLRRVRSWLHGLRAT